MYFTLDLGHEIAKGQKNKERDISTRNSSRLFASSVKLTKWLGLRLILWQADRIDEQSGIVKFLLALQIKHFSGEKVDFPWNTVKEEKYTRITTYLDMHEC